MGFRTAQAASSKPKLLLVASLANANIEGLAKYMSGADAGLLHISKLSTGLKALKKISQIVPDIPWGGWLREIGKERIKRRVKVDCDFLIFPVNTNLAIPQDDKVGRILEVDVSLSEGLLRAVEGLPVDAVLIGSEQEEDNFLAWHHLLLFQHFADLLTKPLLISAPSNVTADELEALWRAGVDGLIVEVGVEQPAERLTELRQAIDKLIFPSRKREKKEALLPHISGEPGTVVEEEED